MLAVLAFVEASIALLFVEESGDLRVTLCAIVAIAIAVITLVSAPATRPFPALAGRRRSGTAGFGRLLVVVCWLLRVGVAGVAAGYIAWNADSDAIQPYAAVLVALSMILLVITQWGQHLAGFVTAVDELRGAGLARRVVAIVVAAVTAGVSSYLAALGERFRSLVMDPVWDHTREQWGLPDFLAGIVVALVGFLGLALIASLVGAAMLSIAFAIGPWTRLGRWLIKYSPVKYTRAVSVARISVVGMYATFPVAPNERATRWIYKGVRDSSGPLDAIFLSMLANDVAAAAAVLAPAGGSIVLRVVGDHEEIVLERGPGETELLHKFPEAAALRRIRLALQNIELGLPSTVRGSTEPDALDRDWSSTHEEPSWFSEPTHEDLAKEVLRYPPGAPWVRERLGLPAFHLDW
ncbi:hypothetical protein E1263_18445 [Kribbella antibiotica]|uniref:Uncharacterized protein n=1 Tax=Kribbella antibiotica TaxID=190195 RepID=A0A4R4ZL70_9ACTN|nr:hypothetical protein [Kribbella antibiotica]TDD58594.1 hypothetical protein E1263_18445 [Kribbella antibiotica]